MNVECATEQGEMTDLHERINFQEKITNILDQYLPETAKVLLTDVQLSDLSCRYRYSSCQIATESPDAKDRVIDGKNTDLIFLLCHDTKF